MSQTNVKHWRRLDNAAKLFPAASSKRDTRVFRFYCELKEDIQQEILQKAVDRTLEKYPIFLSVLRKGLFWHYLEQSNKRPVVREEYKEPCSSLYIRDKRDLLFEVTYYKKRINFEVFHVLTDGTGASEFVRELVKNYLYLAHHEDGLEDVVLSEYSESLFDQEADGFERYYSHQADRKKCKPIFHTKYFHSDQNRSQQSIGCTSKHRRVSKCRAGHRWQSCHTSHHKTKGYSMVEIGSSFSLMIFQVLTFLWDI